MGGSKLYFGQSERRIDSVPLRDHQRKVFVQLLMGPLTSFGVWIIRKIQKGRRT